MAIDPSTYDPFDVEPNHVSEATVFTAGSDREIRRWRISLNQAEQIDSEAPLVAHETSVNALHFDADRDLWTASADGTVKCLSRSHNFLPDTTLQHGDYVRAVAVEEIGGYVLSAGRSEVIKVWDRSSGDLVHKFEGHYEEITGLAILAQRCVSVGIDGTIRSWSLRMEDLQHARRSEEERGTGNNIETNQDTDADGGVRLTEEEEKELEELMLDS